ncbi:hypothetical protein REB14_08830 [Chryseobacterium sp. ES2]|uniref:DUF4177 domain-containing protein n=1 Tax=Chryseobacterium metallicongregator TaxID=3073042 RepID=A0ABU1E394_9FLAO|nr:MULTISPECIES: hypothetical protein [Chryseobacterium]MDR4952273.1 hypothetical protein [Chryseobacterium sp. ES2]
MEKTLMQKSGTTLYTINFDFTSQEQKAILQYLQENGYQLMGYKGATGFDQLNTGVPAWFAINFLDVFDTIEIDCEPQYKVYVYNKGIIEPNSTIQMQALSEEIPLGTAVTFHPDGSFSINGPAPAGMITVRNDRFLGIPNITIGLAAKVNGEFQPFCAFSCMSQGQVTMQPNENIVLFAAQTNMNSGSVTNRTMAPGCKLIFNDKNVKYDLEMIPGTYGITNAPGAAPVAPVSEGQSILQLINIH